MSNETNTNIEDLLNAFEYDSDFRLLKQKYESPNEFTIMGNKRREEWHSNFICWLLDPSQNHNLGTFPLENFLKLLESKRENLTINKTDIGDMKFETEYQIKNRRRIDIWGESPSLLLVIENKIKAPETFTNDAQSQTDDYYEFCEKKYKNKQRCYVLLKAFIKSDVSNKQYIHITYQELFDEIIQPAYLICEQQHLKDTQIVLEKYALDISNPSTSIQLADTQKDISKRIYQRHKTLIDIMRDTIQGSESDNESDIYRFFNNNKKYINNILLKSIGQLPIERSLKKLKGPKLIDALVKASYIVPDQTELVYSYLSATCIIMMDKNHKFYTGYYQGDDYDGSQEVTELRGGLNTFRDAELAVEYAVGSRNGNGGKSIYELTILNSGIKAANGKTIKEILNY